MTVTATPIFDWQPAPRVEITVSDIEATTITVTRTYDGTTELLAGWDRRATSIPALIRDYSVPLEALVSYEVSAFSASGELLSTETSNEVVVYGDLPETHLAIIQDPYRPASAIPVMLRGDAVASLRYSREASLYRTPDGRRIAIGGPLGEAEDVPLSMLTASEADGAALLDIQREAVPLMVRSVQPVELPRVCYVLIDSLVRRPIDRAYAGWTEWEAVATIVKPPSSGYVVAIHTWGEVKAVHDSWGSVAATKASWLDVKRDPRI